MDLENAPEEVKEAIAEYKLGLVDDFKEFMARPELNKLFNEAATQAPLEGKKIMDIVNEKAGERGLSEEDVAIAERRIARSDKLASVLKKHGLA